MGGGGQKYENMQILKIMKKMKIFICDMKRLHLTLLNLIKSGLSL